MPKKQPSFVSRETPVCVSPNKPRTGLINIFTAGSIEGDSATKWQDKFIEERGIRRNPDIQVLNPRRDAWDNSWKQSLNEPNFYQQVNWELDCLGESHIIAMYFDKDTKSPISLLELGMHVNSMDSHGLKKLIVCCPDGYWRKGNVDIVCSRYGIRVFDNWETWMIEINNRINKYH